MVLVMENQSYNQIIGNSSAPFINLLAELDLGAMSILISRQLGDSSPVVFQNAKIVHHPTLLIHTGAKNFYSLDVIELAVQLNGYWAGEPLDIHAEVRRPLAGLCDFPGYQHS